VDVEPVVSLLALSCVFRTHITPPCLAFELAFELAGVDGWDGFAANATAGRPTTTSARSSVILRIRFSPPRRGSKVLLS
jgi:hypothetical protein